MDLRGWIEGGNSGSGAELGHGVSESGRQVRGSLVGKDPGPCLLARES